MLKLKANNFSGTNNKGNHYSITPFILNADGAVVLMKKEFDPEKGEWLNDEKIETVFDLTFLEEFKTPSKEDVVDALKRALIEAEEKWGVTILKADLKIAG